MKKFITFLLMAVISLTACLGLTACNDETESSVVDPRKGNNIVVGYTVYQPMNYTKDNVLVGFDTELAIMTFEALGYNVTFKAIQWKNKYTELSQGTIDCIWNGFTSNGSDKINDVDTPRAQIVDFSYNYMQNAQCILRKDAPAITSPSQLAGKSVAFESGSAGDSLANSYKNSGVNLMPEGLTSQMDAVTKLNNGACDYAIVDIILAEAIVSQSAYSSLSINTGIDIPVEYYAVGFAKNSELTAKVNMAFELFAQTGYLQALADKYNLSTSVITDFSSQK